jgi:hypothetical protein
MENENKPMLSVDAEGNVLKCAKGMTGGECGFTPGMKVCAKCGAAPVEMKMVPVDGEDEEREPTEDEMEIYGDQGEDMTSEKEMGMPSIEISLENEEEEDEEDEEDMESEDEMTPEKSAYLKKYGWTGYKKKYGKLPYMPEKPSMDEEDDEMMAETKGMPRPGKGMGKMPKKPSVMDMSDEDLESIEYEDEEDSMEDEEMMDEEKSMMLEQARKRRISSMGMKEDSLGKDGYVCAIERKAHPAGMSVCDDCPGGCVAEKGLPGLLHIEGLVETEFKGTVIDSGYSGAADMFVVDIQVKDGSVREVFVDGTTAEIVGFHKLDENVFEKKSAFDEMMVIGFAEAADLAVKSIEGHVVAVEPDVFEGIDSYAVEIDGIDGKSYDVFVSLDGEVLGYDKYEAEEAEEIEAEAAEIALKRAFSDEKRTSLAKEGMALPDGSYPIVSEEDLRNAIQAYGRAKDKEATKRHIMKRAKDLGKEKLIPANWVMGGDTTKKSENIDADFIASLVEFELLQSDPEAN